MRARYKGPVAALGGGVLSERRDGVAREQEAAECRERHSQFSAHVFLPGELLYQRIERSLDHGAVFDDQARRDIAAYAEPPGIS